MGDVTRPVRRLAQLYAGLVLYGFSMALQIRAGLGLGPRDGLMTGLVRRTGGSVGAIRTGLEVSVLVVGFTLGGTVGLGTVVYALGIGPLLHVMLPPLTLREPALA